MKYNVSTKVGNMKKIEELVDPSGIILTKNVMDAGISKYSLYSFLEQSSFEQVG